MDRHEYREFMTLAHSAVDSMRDLVKEVKALGVEPQPEIQNLAGPPFCPNCGAFDPDIQTDESPAGRGRLSDAVITGSCANCGDSLIVVVQSYSMHRTKDEAHEELKNPKRGEFFRGRAMSMNEGAGNGRVSDS